MAHYWNLKWLRKVDLNGIYIFLEIIARAKYLLGQFSFFKKDGQWSWLGRIDGTKCKTNIRINHRWNNLIGGPKLSNPSSNLGNMLVSWTKLSK